MSLLMLMSLAVSRFVAHFVGAEFVVEARVVRSIVSSFWPTNTVNIVVSSGLKVVQVLRGIARGGFGGGGLRNQ